MIANQRTVRAMALAALLAGCGGGGEGGAGERTDEVPVAEAPAEPESTIASYAYEGGGLPDTTGLVLPVERIDTAPAAPARAPGREWTAGIVDVAPTAATGMTTLTEVRAARNEGFDRVVFQFAEGVVPGYHLEYIDRPVRQCGSGNTVAVAGDGWLQVRLTPSQAHDESGQPTVRDRARRPGLTVLRELRSTCDFEGQVEWVLGLASPNRFRVMELRSPARLVVDVMH